MDVRVEWTGEWPRKCKGRWIFEVDGKDYRYLLPFANDDGVDLPADTFGEHELWDIDANGDREWFKYENGLDIDCWIDQNREWLTIITPHEDDWDYMFNAFQENDWRFKECAGCLSTKAREAKLRKAQKGNLYVNTVLSIDDELAQYCKGCDTKNTMGIEGVQYKFIFPNGYEAVVMKCYGSYGWNLDLWEVDWINDIDSDIIGNLDDEGVNATLKKVMNY